MRNETKWDKLSVPERAEIIGIFVKNGVYDLDYMRDHYNNLDSETTSDDKPEYVNTYSNGGPIQNLINRINNNSNANFVQRLKDPNRKTIKDWESNGVATHKLSYATDDKGNAIIYPEVQEIDGVLYDFTDPKNKREKWDSYESAISKGDTIMTTPNQADVFTKIYKKYYPGFSNYALGGHLFKYGSEMNSTNDNLPSDWEMQMAGFIKPRSGLGDYFDKYTNEQYQQYYEQQKSRQPKQQAQKLIKKNKPVVLQTQQEIQETLSPEYTRQHALGDIAEAKQTGNVGLFYKGNSYFSPEFYRILNNAHKQYSISQINNTKDRKKLSDSYGVTPFKQPDRSLLEKIKHIFDRSLTANGLIGDNGIFSYLQKPDGPTAEYGAERGTNRYGAYTGYGYMLDPGMDVHKIKGPIDLYHQDALPLGWKKESDYNLFPQYDKTIKDGNYGIVPTYSVQSYYSTRNSKPFDYFSPDTNINSAYSFPIKYPENRDGLAIKSGGDYIDLYTDKRTGKKYYRMRDMYDFNPSSLVSTWGANKHIAQLIDNGGKPFIYTTNWNMVDDPALSDIDKQTLQWNLALMYGQRKQQMEKNNKSEKEIQEYKKFFQSYFNLPDNFENMKIPIRNKENLRK